MEKKDDIHMRCLVYQKLFKEMDYVYRNTAKICGLSECAFWVLYSLRVDDGEPTQSELAFALHQPKQTINSALKQLKARGFLRLNHNNGRRHKPIELTEPGINFAERTVDKVISAEVSALSHMSDSEQQMLLQLFSEHTNLLKSHVQDILRGGKG